MLLRTLLTASLIAGPIASAHAELALPSPSRTLDIGRVEPGAQVHAIDIRSADDVRAALRLAAARNLKVSVRGTNHSQGGHNFLADSNGKPGAIQLITTSWNRVLHLDSEARQVTVEPGIIWAELQRELDAAGFAIVTQQSSNIFSVGGAVATNVHGRDNQGPIRNSVVSLKLITADGAEHLLSRTRNRPWFDAVIGGYGAFGVISEITLAIAPNQAYRARSARRIDTRTYLHDFIEPLREAGTGQQVLHWARVGIHGERGGIALGPISAVTWSVAEQQPDSRWPGWRLNQERAMENGAASALMRAARASDRGKTLKSQLDDRVGTPATGTVQTRNNIMSPPVRFLLDYGASTPGANDILQEYFIPPARLADFIEQLQTVTRQHHLNLLNVTLRYLPPATGSSLLAYDGPGDLIAVVLYFNVEDQQGRREAQVHYSGERWTQALIESALTLGGNFYLPYQRWWSGDQLSRGYGDADIARFIALKQRIDPDYRFDSNFIRALHQSRTAQEHTAPR